MAGFNLPTDSHHAGRGSQVRRHADRICEAGEEILAEVAGFSVDTVDRHLGELCRLGFIIYKGQAPSTGYTINKSGKRVKKKGINRYTVLDAFRPNSGELYLPLPRQIMKLPISRGGQRLYAAIVLRCGIYDDEHYQGYTDLGAEKLADDAGLGLTTTKESLKSLKAVSLIRRQVYKNNESRTEALPYSCYTPLKATGSVDGQTTGTVDDQVTGRSAVKRPARVRV